MPYRSRIKAIAAKIHRLTTKVIKNPRPANKTANQFSTLFSTTHKNPGFHKGHILLTKQIIYSDVKLIQFLSDNTHL